MRAVVERWGFNRRLLQADFPTALGRELSEDEGVPRKEVAMGLQRNLEPIDALA